MNPLKSSAATIAIVCARLRAEWPLMLVLCAASFILGCEQGNSLSAQGDFCGADVTPRLIWLMHPMFFVTALGIVGGFCNHDVGVVSELQLLEESAPLYGRQLARARAVVPCIIVACATLTYWCAASLEGSTPPPYFAVLVLSGATCTVLIALSASIRTGWPRLLYVALAFGNAFIALQIAGNFPCFSPLAVIGELAFCVLVGFVALRAYGETLARYDPVPTRS
ncbi:MAG: hypothetical protein M3160_03800 [Candidatus Eremiobacteraeota bacterium]|nr:hypothetical protein [Candidatus Eremiobacteraeota bacterium]